MMQLLEFMPIILFFLTYQMDGNTIELSNYSYTVDGIFTATAVLMVATVLQVIITFLVKREVEKKLWWMLAAVLAFGAATLLLRNELFIQWKPTIFNWVLAVAFLGSQFIGEKNFIERMLGSQLTLPKAKWRTLNLCWVANFLIVGALNIYVAYNFSEATWVSYKLWSSIAFTLAIMAVTIVILLPHLKEQEETTS